MAACADPPTGATAAAAGAMAAAAAAAVRAALEDTEDEILELRAVYEQIMRDKARAEGKLRKRGS